MRVSFTMHPILIDLIFLIMNLFEGGMNYETPYHAVFPLLAVGPIKIYPFLTPCLNGICFKREVNIFKLCCRIS